MLPRLPQPVKICLGSILAAFLIGLQNIDEYAQQLESKYPEQMELPEMLRNISLYTGLPQWFELQKDLYTSLGASEGVEEEFPNDEPDFQITEEAVEEPEPAPVQVTEPPVEEKKETPSEKKEEPVKQSAGISATEPPAPPVDVKPAEVEVPRPRVRNRLGLVWKKSVRKLTRRRLRSSYPRRLKNRGNRKRWKQLKRRNVPQEPWPRPEPPLQPEPAPAPQPEPVLQPEPTPAPQPEPVPAPQPEPVPAPQPAPAPEPEPEPQPEIEPSLQDMVAFNKENPVHYRIMLMGDSLMEDLGPATYRAMRNRNGLHFFLTAKFSTGLCRPEYFNWPLNMENTVKNTRPDAIVVFIGANDGLAIRMGNRVVYPNNPEKWSEAYGIRTKEIIDIARKYNCDLLWVGMPPMGSKYAKLLKNTADTQRAVCQANGVPFLDTVEVLGDAKGEFRPYMTDSNGRTVRLREKDKEHITAAGNALIVNRLVPRLERMIYTFGQKHPEKRLSENEIRNKSNARMDVTIKYAPNKRRK